MDGHTARWDLTAPNAATLGFPLLGRWEHLRCPQMVLIWILNGVILGRTSTQSSSYIARERRFFCRSVQRTVVEKTPQVMTSIGLQLYRSAAAKIGIPAQHFCPMLRPLASSHDLPTADGDVCQSTPLVSITPLSMFIHPTSFRHILLSHVAVLCRQVSVES